MLISKTKFRILWLRQKWNHPSIPHLTVTQFWQQATLTSGSKIYIFTFKNKIQSWPQFTSKINLHYSLVSSHKVYDMSTSPLIYTSGLFKVSKNVTKFINYYLHSIHTPWLNYHGLISINSCSNDRIITELHPDNITDLIFLLLNHFIKYSSGFI